MRLVIALLLAGCAAPSAASRESRPARPLEPEQPEASAWVHAVPSPLVLQESSREEGSEEVRPPPPPPEPGPPAEVTAHEPAPAYATLFQPRRQYHYAVVDDVDPHAPEGGRTVTRASVTCGVELQSYYGALGSELSCRSGSPDAVVDIFERSFVFLSAPGGLWMPASLPVDQDDVGDVIIEPPLVAERPLTTARSFERPGSGDGEAEPCTRRVSVGARSTCFEERCRVTTGYGDTRVHLCVSARGMESFTTENVAGPRTVKWRLQRVEELPEEHGCAG